MTKIERIIKVCNTCNSVRLHEILETVCGIYIDPKVCAMDRTTYVDMIEGTLVYDNNIDIDMLFDALHELNEF